MRHFIGNHRNIGRAAHRNPIAGPHLDRNAVGQLDRISGAISDQLPENGAVAQDAVDPVKHDDRGTLIPRNYEGNADLAGDKHITVITQRGNPTIEDSERLSLTGAAAGDHNQLATHAARFAIAASESPEFLALIISQRFAGGGDQQDPPTKPRFTWHDRTEQIRIGECFAHRDAGLHFDTAIGSHGWAKRSASVVEVTARSKARMKS